MQRLLMALHAASDSTTMPSSALMDATKSIALALSTNVKGLIFSISPEANEEVQKLFVYKPVMVLLVESKLSRDTTKPTAIAMMAARTRCPSERNSQDSCLRSLTFGALTTFGRGCAIVCSSAAAAFASPVLLSDDDE